MQCIFFQNYMYSQTCDGRCSGLMFNVLCGTSGLSSVGSRAGKGHYVVFLRKTCYSQTASLTPRTLNGAGILKVMTQK